MTVEYDHPASRIPNPASLDLVPNEDFFSTAYSQEVRTHALFLLHYIRATLIGASGESPTLDDLQTHLLALKGQGVYINYPSPKFLLSPNPDETTKFLAGQVLSTLRIGAVHVNDLDPEVIQEFLVYDPSTHLYRTTDDNLQRIPPVTDLRLFAAKSEDTARLMILFGASDHARRRHLGEL